MNTLENDLSARRSHKYQNMAGTGQSWAADGNRDINASVTSQSFLPNISNPQPIKRRPPLGDAPPKGGVGAGFKRDRTSIGGTQSGRAAGFSSQNDESTSMRSSARYAGAPPNPNAMQTQNSFGGIS